MQDTVASYHAGQKLFLRKGSDFLLLTSPDNTYDLPGGRINTSENQTPLASILAREVREELGESLVYKQGKPLFAFRRFRPDLGLQVFILVYDAEYVSGDYTLSHEHIAARWQNMNSFQFTIQNFVSPEEYESFKLFFDKAH